MNVRRSLFASALAAAPLFLLVFCKTNSINSNTNNDSFEVGAAGGDFGTPQGLLVHVPANAVSGTVTINVDPGVTSAEYQPLPTGQTLASPVFSLSPHGTTFLLAVTITIPYDASKLNGATPGLLHAGGTDPSKSAWDILPATAGPEELINSVPTRTVVLSTNSFSYFAVSQGPPAQDASAGDASTVAADGAPPQDDSGPPQIDASAPPIDSGRGNPG